MCVWLAGLAAAMLLLRHDIFGRTHVADLWIEYYTHVPAHVMWNMCVCSHVFMDQMEKYEHYRGRACEALTSTHTQTRLHATLAHM